MVDQDDRSHEIYSGVAPVFEQNGPKQRQQQQQQQRCMQCNNAMHFRVSHMVVILGHEGK